MIQITQMVHKESQASSKKLKDNLLVFFGNAVPAQTFYREGANISWIDAVSPKRLDERDSVSKFIFRKQISVRCNYRAKIVSECDVNRRAIIKSTNAHIQHVLCRLRRFLS